MLQSELTRYNNCGRSVGGLGSIHAIISGQEIISVGVDLRQANSPRNQSICANPKTAIVKSDNLDALMMFYKSLASEDEKKRFMECLINRIDEHKGYLSVSYFIVCVFWEIRILA